MSFMRKMFISLLGISLIVPLTALNMGLAADEIVEVWITTPDQQKLLQKESNIQFSTNSGPAGITINVDETIEYQEIDGFGASVTGSSAYLLNQSLNPSQRNQILNDLFGNDGIGLSFLRQPIGASDFNLSSYSYNDMPPGQTDPNLFNFSIQQDEVNIIPILQQITGINTDLKILGTPWSPPGWMKDSDSLHGGSLKLEHYQALADYFVKFIEAYEAKGLPIYAITVQNEPYHNTTSYPSMYMEPLEQRNFIKNNLGPTFQNQNIDTKIIGFDHNWKYVDYPLELLNDADAKQYMAGTAFHCYEDPTDPGLQSVVYNAHPDKGVWFTECTGGTWAEDFGGNLQWELSNLFIGTTRNWAKSVTLWNLALDQNNGPINGGCGTCRGVITINDQSGDITKNVEYYVLGHFSKFVKPGAKRIESNQTEIENVAFKNPDGSKVLIALNTASDQRTFKVNWGSQSFNYNLPGGAAVTFKWSGEQTGGGDPQPINAYEQVEAENYSSMIGVQTEPTSDIGGGLNVGWIDDGDYIAFKDIDFGVGDGATAMEARVASESQGGSFEIRLDSSTGTLVGTMDINNTGGWQTWVTNTTSISGVTGIHDVYFVFKGGLDEGIGNLNWFKFTKDVIVPPDPSLIDAFSQIEAEEYTTMDGVQTESTSDVGGGLNVGWIDDGDYIAFKEVDFGNGDGAAGFEARVASESDGGSVELRLGSITGQLIGTLDVSNTGGWQSWVTSSISVEDTAGVHDLYLIFKGGSSIGNLNWFTFTESFTPTPINIKIEAEDYTTMNGVQTESTSDVGGGLNVGWIDGGDSLSYSNIDFQTGVTSVDVRVASESEGGVIELRVDQIDGPVIGTVSFTNTGGWQNWETKTTSIQSTSGIHDVYLLFIGDSDLGNVNWIEFKE
ncbi:carbohydrate-binding protein [Chengkuizengella axinellae]|uniref:Carbohydrate-binding protein n=1 Tax=Chengkuizengella axinellae TaxID=3064388 RepID=A0ABT9J369_9BACL|nr:carbohydrate-binding protein [Chengkuizengella sp. 2205SS18-9]MDP5275923.1 carbohydrate-binding protein [Chengkuizengella sp. 2205SS18-9]